MRGPALGADVDVKQDDGVQGAFDGDGRSGGDAQRQQQGSMIPARAAPETMLRSLMGRTIAAGEGRGFG